MILYVLTTISYSRRELVQYFIVIAVVKPRTIFCTVNFDMLQTPGDVYHMVFLWFYKTIPLVVGFRLFLSALSV